MKFARIGRLTFILTLISALLLVVVPAHAQDTPPNTIMVTGQGTFSAVPDIATVILGVEFVNADLTTAFQQTGQAMGNITTTLQNLGIAATDIQTTGVNVIPQDQLDASGNPVGRTFRVSNSVMVTVKDLNLVETVLTSAVTAGANTVSNLTFGYQNTGRLENRARALALEDAKGNAEQIATALGVTLGAPLSAVEISISSPLPSVDRASVGIQPISPGKISTTISVQVTYAIGGPAA
jgi:uncharacterized protein YggE